MGEERMRELGIPRRSFLGKTAAAAFAAPVVVSFGLDGIAEASPGQFLPNQCVANQSFPNQDAALEAVLPALEELFRLVARALADNQLGFAPAAALEESVVLITLQVASGRYSAACQTLFELSQNVERGQLPPFLADELLFSIRQAQGPLGCSCFAPGPYGP